MNVSPCENEGLDGVVRDDSGLDGERRRRDSNSGWRFCRPLPDTPKRHGGKGLRLSTRVEDPNLPTAAYSFPPDLAAVVSAWPELPDAIRAGILAMVRAARS